MNEEIKQIPLEERIEKLFESGWVNEFNYLENQLQEARCLVSILQQELDQYKNNWEELEKWLISYRTNIDNPDFYEDGIIDCLDETLNKLKSLKEGK